MSMTELRQDLRPTGKFLTRLGFLLAAMLLGGALCLQRQGLPKVEADRLAIDGAPLPTALSDFDVDSKHLVVHGPFKSHLDTTATHTELRPRLDGPDAGGGDDLGVEPGAPCDVPAECSGGGLAVTSQVSPKIHHRWVWDAGIGAGDPQIAAGPTCLLVSAYKKFAYLDKTDGRFLPRSEERR